MKDLLMSSNDLLGPVIAMVGLTIAVTLYMFARRVPAVTKAKMTNKEMNTVGAMDHLPDSARFPSDNFRNLSEVPVIFYATCFAAMFAGAGGDLMVNLAWAYVVLRAVHSFIHCTYNKVQHRFFAFLASNFVLIIMWAQLANTYFLG